MNKERLSKLQKWILCQAYLEGRVSRSQIYKEFYDLRWEKWRRWHRDMPLHLKETHEKFLNSKEYKEYLKVTDKAYKIYPAVSHSLKSLRERGLIEMRKGYKGYLDPIRLTDRGRKVVEELNE